MFSFFCFSPTVFAASTESAGLSPAIMTVNGHIAPGSHFFVTNFYATNKSATPETCSVKPQSVLDVSTKSFTLPGNGKVKIPVSMNIAKNAKLGYQKVYVVLDCTSPKFANTVGVGATIYFTVGNNFFMHLIGTLWGKVVIFAIAFGLFIAITYLVQKLKKKEG